MAEHSGGGRSDPGLKWLVFGGVAGLGILALLVAFLADSANKSGGVGDGILGLGVLGLLAILGLGPVGRAIGRRISEGGPQAQSVDHDLDELRLQNDDLRQMLTEMQERVDFAERLLARGTESIRKDVN